MNNNRGSGANELAKKAGAAIGAAPDELRNAAQNGDIDRIISKLSPQQAEKLRGILSDEQAAKKLLATPQAQALIKSFTKK